MQLRTPAPGLDVAVAQGVWDSPKVVRPYPLKPLGPSLHVWSRSVPAEPLPELRPVLLRVQRSLYLLFTYQT
ncbi:hypothetical protein RR46_06761 [Papilio xuthus]|uniref:Uncharacterized protein n=1 Tax=Papilio xuthus TaxID=66420 RepID=A0A194PRT9_PAPXU|nr:hypothetical protein RR46_06761 [Papilio xuthus]